MADEIIDMSALEAQMKEVNAKFEEFRKITQETSKKVFHQAVAAFFAAYPEVHAIRWQQYTPYFCDGDTCEFSVGVPRFYSKEDFEEGVDDGYEYSSWQKPSEYVYKSAADKTNKYWEQYQEDIDTYEELEKKVGKTRIKELSSGIQRFSKLFNSINDDTMLALFGDHAQVTVTTEGIDVDEYSHD